jgi:hypothetical protein
MRRKGGERKRLRALVAGAVSPVVVGSIGHEEALEAGVPES